VAQTVTIGEQKVCPESEWLKFSTTPTPTPQVENPSDSDSSTPTPQPCWAPQKQQRISRRVPQKRVIGGPYLLIRARFGWYEALG